MALIRTKLKQLRDADVRFISIVDRAATRIPFRVLKRDKENQMGIDLTKVLKSDNNPQKPFVSALVVDAQKDEAAGSAVLDAIKAHGFAVDRVTKSEDTTLVYKQTEQKGEVTTVRLSEHLLVDVANLVTPEGFIGEMVKKNGFFPDLRMATSALYDQMVEVAKSETPQQGAEAALMSYGTYLNQMLVLPANSFKLEAAIADIVKKCACAEEKTVTKEETDEEKEKNKLPPAEQSGSELAPKDEDDDQKEPPDAVKKEVVAEVKKADEGQTAILTALSAIQTNLTSLTTKVESVVTEQEAQKKVLDDVVKKAETLSGTLKGTVVAPVVREDRPAGPALMRVEKSDDDPRKGNFDTAFLRRRK